jgi:8-oxo-dGTP diphosphatase
MKETIVTSQGSSAVLLNPQNEVLLCLRDDKAGIPYPGRWDVLGGHVEAGELPAECIARELHEEIGYDTKHPTLFRRYDLADRIEWMYWERADIDIAATVLTEGQRLAWFSRNQIEHMADDEFAFGFKSLLLDFFHARPFDR